MLETLNWLTITTPFFAGYAAFDWGRNAGEGNVVPLIVGALAFLGLIFVWFIMFQFLRFPFWMGHFT